MIARGLWLLLIAALGVVAVGAGLDREARRGDLPTRLVPAPFRSFAEERIAAAAVRSGSPAEALASARRLVARRPVPAENLMLLGLAQLRAGQAEQGTVAIQTAARRGWRDVGAQKVMLGLAFEAGDYDEVANRVAALWIAPGAEDEALADTRRLLAAPGGQEAFARRLAAGGYWTKGPLRQAGELDPEAFSQSIAFANAAGTEFDCRTLARIARSYLASGNEAASRRTWSGRCATGQQLSDAP